MTAKNETPDLETTQEATNSPDRTLSRRRFLGGLAIASAVPALQSGSNRTGGNQPEDDEEDDDEVDTHFELGAEVDGWQGQSPSEIEGETNPTLDLQAGNEYRVTWENLDGVQHNFAILDADGNEIESTEIMSVEGSTRSLTFTATREMAQYYCSIHTDGMRGEVQIDDETPTDDTPTEADEEIETRFELGAVIDGWQGRLPEERDAENYIEGEQNPTLELEAGARYMVVWENADGVPHDFAIQDADGNQMLSTEITDKQGEKLSLTFTATREMDHYVCTIHPDTMRGEIEVGGGGGKLAMDPVQTVGGMAAATAGVVAGLSYALSRHFGESNEP